MTGPTGLVLVRHGRPDILQDRPAAAWELRDDARPDIRRLARALPRPRVIVASDEPKAEETGKIIREAVGGDFRVDARLREVTRPDEWIPNYEDRATRYLTRGHEPGWEPADAVLIRVTGAVNELPAGAMVVGHGLSLTLYTSTLVTFDHVEFWRGLRLPDAWIAADGTTPQRIELPRRPENPR